MSSLLPAVAISPLRQTLIDEMTLRWFSPEAVAPVAL